MRTGPAFVSRDYALDTACPLAMESCPGAWSSADWNGSTAEDKRVSRQISATTAACWISATHHGSVPRAEFPKDGELVVDSYREDANSPFSMTRRTAQWHGRDQGSEFVHKARSLRLILSPDRSSKPKFRWHKSGFLTVSAAGDTPNLSQQPRHSLMYQLVTRNGDTPHSLARCVHFPGREGNPNQCCDSHLHKQGSVLRGPCWR